MEKAVHLLPFHYNVLRGGLTFLCLSSFLLYALMFSAYVGLVSENQSWRDSYLKEKVLLKPQSIWVTHYYWHYRIQWCENREVKNTFIYY